MKKKKSREKGKIKISRIFQKLEIGDKVAVERELSLKSGFPKILEGRTGIIEAIRGKAYIVKISDGNKEKKYIIRPIHLKKIKNQETSKISDF